MCAACVLQFVRTLCNKCINCLRGKSAVFCGCYNKPKNPEDFYVRRFINPEKTAFIVRLLD